MEVIEFKDRLKYALEIRNIKPIDLSYKLNVNRGIISQYLSGRYKPNHRRILEMSKILKVNPAWLMGFDVNIEDNMIEITQEEFIKETLELLERTNMNKKDKDYLIKTIKMIGDKK